MNFASLLSGPLWELLNHTRQQPGASLELFDSRLRPVFAESSDPRVVIVRRAAGVKFMGRGEMSFEQVLQSGEDVQVRMADWWMALLPVRVLHRPVALLVAVAQFAPDAPFDPASDPVAHGRAWRIVIEADLQTTQRLRTEDQRAQRAMSVARLAADLQHCVREHQLLSAVLQALSVWHNVEARAYCRDLTGTFVLRATLPGVDTAVVPRVLNPPSARQPRGGAAPLRRVEQLRSHTLRDEWCFLVRTGDAEQWLIVADGSVEADIVAQVESLFRAFSAALERVRQYEAAALRALVHDTISARGLAADPVQLATALLAAICRHLEATEAEWTMRNDAMVPHGQGHGSTVPGTTLSVSLPIGAARLGEIRLRRGNDEPFHCGHAEALAALKPMLVAWLAGGAGALDWRATSRSPATPGSGNSPRVKVAQ